MQKDGCGGGDICNPKIPMTEKRMKQKIQPET